MTQRLFVTGMLRSGTSLLQTLLTNHPQMLVIYQPFHQLHVDVKRIFLREYGDERILPLDDGSPGRLQENQAFEDWLGTRIFSAEESRWLAQRATTGKGGGVPELTGKLGAPAGTFFEVADSLHSALTRRLGHGAGLMLVGSKEILCEEYIPASLDANVNCILIIRDPRAAIASANNGRYREIVGDRYPLLMLIRLWRKSAACWLRCRRHPRMWVVRYEDLIESPEKHLNDIAGWLGLDSFPENVLQGQLLDHAGRPWEGNSSFGDKPVVDASAGNVWQGKLDRAEIDFIEACTAPEMSSLGYRRQGLGDRAAIETFVEDTSCVRPSYLDIHGLDSDRRSQELRLWDSRNLDIASTMGHQQV